MAVHTFTSNGITTKREAVPIRQREGGNSIVRLKIDVISVSNRLRAINPDYVLELAESIDKNGLLSPIIVTKENMLVAGAHRLAACKQLGHAEIDCIVQDCNALQAELMEIDENLIRRELHWLEIGEHARRRNIIWEQMGFRAKSGTNVKNSRTGESDSSVPKTTDGIAAEMGIVGRTLQQYIQLASDLTAEAKDAVRAQDIPKTLALELSRLKPETQRKVVKQGNITLAAVRKYKSASKTGTNKGGKRKGASEVPDPSVPLDKEHQPSAVPILYQDGGETTLSIQPSLTEQPSVLGQAVESQDEFRSVLAKIRDVETAVKECPSLFQEATNLAVSLEQKLALKESVDAAYSGFNTVAGQLRRNYGADLT